VAVIAGGLQGDSNQVSGPNDKHQMTNDKNTACALNTLGIHGKRPRLTNIAQQILENLDVKICPVVKLLRVASMAELAHTKSDWRTVHKLERRANELIMKVDPADHWNVRGVFKYLRLAASPRKQNVSG